MMAGLAQQGVPAIGPDEKFEHQCEFHHRAPPGCSLTGECLGKYAISGNRPTVAQSVVIYLTPNSVTARIAVRHGG
jgi:hypothetical protein